MFVRVENLYLLLSLGIALGTGIEIIEFLVDVVLTPKIPYQPSLIDTDLDLISDIIGSIIAALHLNILLVILYSMIVKVCCSEDDMILYDKTITRHHIPRKIASLTYAHIGKRWRSLYFCTCNEKAMYGIFWSVVKNKGDSNHGSLC